MPRVRVARVHAARQLERETQAEPEAAIAARGADPAALVAHGHDERAVLDARTQLEGRIVDGLALVGMQDDVRAGLGDD